MGFSFKAMWNNKCPRCRQGDIFVKPLVLSNPLNMPHSCEHCGQLTEPEPGFYYGAMFISYIASVFFLLIPTLILVFYFKWSVESAMGFTIFLGVITYLKFLRGSRSAWFHMMVKHNPKVEKEVKFKIASSNNKDWKPNLSKMKIK